MKKTLLSIACGCAVMPWGMALAQPASADSLMEALGEGDTNVNLRLRYESVEWDGLSDSDALTLKTRLNYTTQVYKGFSAGIEMDDVQALTDVDYRTAGNDSAYPGTAVIADPEGTEVNRAYVSYQLKGTQAKYGRQRILLDNQRFVGGVGWRQNEQTYDAFSVTSETVDSLRVFYAYVYNVNRIFGEQNPIGDHDHETHLLNINYSGWSAGKLSAYAYLLDNQSAAGLSSDTYGARWMGQLGDGFRYNLEYATQSDAGDNPVSYDADYLLAEAMADVGPVTFKAGWESLGSDDGVQAFTTSLATLHKFQGWTDRFLGTPVEGVDDAYLGVGAKLAGVKFSATYHELGADVGSADYGSEWDLSAARAFGPVKVLLKYADYQADDYASDTRKLWVQLQTAF